VVSFAAASAAGSIALLMSVTAAVAEAAATSDHELVRQFVYGCPSDPREVGFNVGDSQNMVVWCSWRSQGDVETGR
jgi:hypothetical protein